MQFINPTTDFAFKKIFGRPESSDMNHIPEVLVQEVAIEHAFDIANRAQMSEEEWELQERREMFIQDQRGIREKGLLDGEVIGAHKKALDAAKNLKAMGMADEQIAQALGLSLADVTGC